MRQVHEAATIIEHLALNHPGPVALVPDDPAAAIEARMLDRVFDNYVMTPMQKLVSDSMRAEADGDSVGSGQARAKLDAIYIWLDARMMEREWAAGAFGLADCAAAPSLFYADWVHRIAPSFTHLRAYRARLLARPSAARCVEEARP